MRIERLIIKARKLLFLAARSQKLVAGKKWFMSAAVEIRSSVKNKSQREHMSKAPTHAIALICYLPPNPAFKRTAFGGRLI